MDEAALLGRRELGLLKQVSLFKFLSVFCLRRLFSFFNCRGLFSHSVSIFFCLRLDNLSYVAPSASLSSPLYSCLLLPHPFLSSTSTYGGSPVAFLPFFSERWTGGGGGAGSSERGKKGPVKQREVVCRRGRQETQVSQDSPPVIAPWLSCRPTADWS